MRDELDIGEKILVMLHREVGRCSHCGKRECAGRKSGSYLPNIIPTSVLMGALRELGVDI